MSEGNSYRQILRSSTILGGATVVNILVSLLRTKVVAVVLGPPGVGLIGLLQSLMATASELSALGFGTVGTRQIAEATGSDNPQAVAVARRALFWGTLVLAASGAALFWLLRDTLAEKVFGDREINGSIGWLAVGVALTVASRSQGALLNGTRRLGDLARVSVLSTLLSAALGIGALWLWGEKGMIAFVLSVPLASFLLGYWFVSRLPRILASPTTLLQLLKQWKVLARLGATFMLAGVTVAVGQLALRGIVQHGLGTEALGYFQAAWTISMTYIGFVLYSIGTDYYPRLTAAFRDHATVNRIVNEQTEVSLLLAGPVLLAMLGLAPWIIGLLYSDRFADAASVLRWQVLGDILKVASWPLGIVILAAGDGRTYMLSESLAIAVLVGLTWIILPLVGIQATGIAFVGMYLAYLPTVLLLARRRTSFAWNRRVYIHLLLLIVVGIVVFLGALLSKWLGACLGLIGATVLGMHGLARLGHMANLGGPVGRVAMFSRRALVKTRVWRD
ncbi:MAG: O-antigen translocase [Gammaproteobacteria bacterium]